MRPWECLALLLLVSCGDNKLVQGRRQEQAEMMRDRMVTVCIAGHRYGVVRSVREYMVFPLFNSHHTPQACEEQP